MLRRHVLWIIVAGLLLAAGIGAFVWKNQQARPAVPPAPAASQPAALEFLPTDIAQAERRTLRRLLPVSGSLRAVNQASVKARVGGTVNEVLVREGEAVQAGQVLVRMDTSEYQARLDQAKGALAAARAQLDIAAKTRDNNKALVEKGFISKNAFDNAESQFNVARANVDSARGALDVAQKALNDTIIRAPIAGLVSSRSVQPGEKVSPDARLLDIVDLRQMEMEAGVPAPDIIHVNVGQEVQISVEGLPAPVTGKVTRINPTTQPGSRSILTYIQIANPDGMLRAGMFGTAQLTIAGKTGVLTVPESAVRTDGGNHYVYAIDNGRLAQRSVTLGMRGDDGKGPAVEIIDGLEAGTQVVKTNLGRLPVGTPVKISQLTSVAAAANKAEQK